MDAVQTVFNILVADRVEVVLSDARGACVSGSEGGVGESHSLEPVAVL